MTERSFDLAVVGSLNLDYTMTVPHWPRPGETVSAVDLRTSLGGKGANQASAAAQLGSRVCMIGKVGADGERAVAALRAHGVDVSSIGWHPSRPTGSAFITVDPHGENSIVIAAGANADTSASTVREAHELIETSTVSLTQMECGAEPVDALADIVEHAGTRFVFNLAPAVAPGRRAVALADPLVVNELEIAAVIGGPVKAVSHALAAANGLVADGVRSVVVTLGANGCVIATATGEKHIPAVPAEVIDSTGAGDAFVGALCHALAAGAELDEAASFGTRVAAVAVATTGARLPEPLPLSL